MFIDLLGILLASVLVVLAHEVAPSLPTIALWGDRPAPRIYGCIDLRTGRPCKAGQAGAAASKATVQRTDRCVRRAMEARRTLWPAFRSVYRPEFAGVVLSRPALLPILLGHGRPRDWRERRALHFAPAWQAA